MHLISDVGSFYDNTNSSVRIQNLLKGGGAFHLDGEIITNVNTVFPRGSDPFSIVSHYIKRVATSWTYSILR